MKNIPAMKKHPPTIRKGPSVASQYCKHNHPPSDHIARPSFRDDSRETLEIREQQKDQRSSKNADRPGQESDQRAQIENTVLQAKNRSDLKWFEQKTSIFQARMLIVQARSKERYDG